MRGLKRTTRCRARRARFTLRRSSSVLPLNIEPHTTSTQPQRRALEPASPWGDANARCSPCECCGSIFARILGGSVGDKPASPAARPWNRWAGEKRQHQRMGQGPPTHPPTWAGPGRGSTARPGRPIWLNFIAKLSQSERAERGLPISPHRRQAPRRLLTYSRERGPPRP
jgi:hypothetical protein